jgi:regulator of RNase E activity RraA
MYLCDEASLLRRIDAVSPDVCADANGVTVVDASLAAICMTRARARAEAAVRTNTSPAVSIAAN